MNTPYRFRIPLIQRMVEEHVVILRALDILNVAAKMLGREQVMKTSDLSTLIRFFREYADHIHHYSEEDILFAALENGRSRTLRSMIAKLGTQHVISRMLVAQMSDALSGARSGRRGWRRQFIENALAYHALLSVHICDEDHVFFPAADKALSSGDSNLKSKRTKEAASSKRWEKRINRLSRELLPTPLAISVSDSLVR